MHVRLWVALLLLIHPVPLSHTLRSRYTGSNDHRRLCAAVAARRAHLSDAEGGTSHVPWRAVLCSASTYIHIKRILTSIIAVIPFLY